MMPPGAKPSSGTRHAWIDSAKGLGILLVVFGHVWRGLHEAALPVEEGLYRAVDNSIYGFHMALFFFLSGLFLERSVSKSASRFAADKLRNIAYPYIVWSLLYGAMNLALSRWTNHRPTLVDIASIVYRPYAHFWFLYVLGLASALYFLLRRARLGPAAIAGLALAFGATDGLLDLGGWNVPYQLRHYFVYLAAGAWAGNGLEARLFRAGTPAAAAASLLSFAAMLALGRGHDDHGYAAQWLIASAGIAGSIFFAAAIRGRAWSRAFQILGFYSLPIYVAHTLATAAARIVLQKLFHVTSIGVHCGVGLVAGVTFPLVLALAAERLNLPFIFRWAPRAAAAPETPGAVPERARAPAPDPAAAIVPRSSRASSMPSGFEDRQARDSASWAR